MPKKKTKKKKKMGFFFNIQHLPINKDTKKTFN